MKTKTPLNTAILAAAAIGTALVITAAPVNAAGSKEKCYGISQAGKNDCSTATSSCAGTSKVDRQSDAFLAVPKGLCLKISGGSLKSKKS